ncbi:hypothetical protein [Janthinobacterium sp.]|uniref:hypothetical protein n=1 Tax=Janthinobacterium sp. TaxID=1871054 RepID=UPI00293D8D72|nr:hypothetical protein [Janthinobacterium sp.]
MKQIDTVSRRGGRGARKALKATLALAFLIGAALCTNAWAGPGGHGHAQGVHADGVHGNGVHGNGFHGNGFHDHGFHDHGRARLGIAVGAPLWWYGPGWYGGPYYGYPYPYGYSYAMPPVGYVERGATLWYYCANPQGYYPYVKECSTDWRVVVPESVTP